MSYPSLALDPAVPATAPPGAAAVSFASSLARMESVFSAHSAEASRQLQAAHEDLMRLKNLLDEAMGSLGNSFTQLAPLIANIEGVTGATAELAVTTLQYQDICTQLVDHLRERLASTGLLVDAMQAPLVQALAGMRGDHAAMAAVAAHVDTMHEELDRARALCRDNPVRHDSLAPGDIELF